MVLNLLNGFGQNFNIMEKFIEFIQESIKTIENMELNDQDKSLVASRLDSICGLLQITMFHLKTQQDEKS
jgi:hypothetical protein